MWWFGIMGCSLLGPSWTPCSSQAPCQQSFGADFTCNESTGYCESAGSSVLADTASQDDDSASSGEDSERPGEDSSAGGGDSEEDSPDAWLEDLDPRCRLLPEDWEQSQGETLIGGVLDGYNQAEEILAVELAVSQLESSGYGMVLCNNQADPSNYYDGLDKEEATSKLMTLLGVTLDLGVIVGPGTSEAVLASFRQLEEQDVVFVTPTAGADGLEVLDESVGYKKIWQMVGHHSELLSNLEQFLMIYEPGYYWVMFLHTLDTNNPAADIEDLYWIDDLQSRLEAETFTVSVSSIEDDTPIEEQDFFQELSSGFWDAVFVQADDRSTYSRLMHSMKNAPDTYGHLDRLDVYLGPWSLRSSLVDEYSVQVPGNLRSFGPSITHGSEANIYPDFAEHFESFTSLRAADNPGATFAYDATFFAYLGTAWAEIQGDTHSGALVSQGMQRLFSDGAYKQPLGPEAFAKAKELFEQGESIDLEGASGGLDFSPGSLLRSTSADIWQVSGSGGDLLARCEDRSCWNP